MNISLGFEIKVHQSQGFKVAKKLQKVHVKKLIVGGLMKGQSFLLLNTLYKRDSGKNEKSAAWKII